MSSPEEYAQFLDFSARLYRYPLTESLSIYAQRPDAQAVATYDEWNNPKIGRAVSKGAKALRILDRSDLNRYKNVFELSDTHGREFVINQRFDIPVEAKEHLLQALGVDVANDSTQSLGYDFDVYFKQAAESYSEKCYNADVSDAASISNSLTQNQLQVLQDTDFKALVINSATYNICKRFGVPFGNELDVFGSIDKFTSHDIATVLGNMNQAISSQGISHIANTLSKVKTEMEATHGQGNIEASRRPEAERNHEPVEGIFENVTTREGSFLPSNGATQGRPDSGGNPDTGIRGHGGLPDNIQEGSGGGQRPADSRNRGQQPTGALGQVQLSLDGIHDAQSPSPDESTGDRRHMEGSRAGGTTGSIADDRRLGEEIRGQQQEAPGGLHGDTPLGERQENLGRGSNDTSDTLYNEINIVSEKGPANAEPFLVANQSEVEWDDYVEFLKSSTYGYNGPFVAIRSSESDNVNTFEDSADNLFPNTLKFKTLTFAQADRMFRDVEAAERAERRRIGDFDDYHMTYGTIFYKEKSTDSELTTHDFRYNLGLYKGNDSGLYNDINNQWNDAQERLNEINEEGGWAAFTQDDINAARHMLSLCRPERHEATSANYIIQSESAIGIASGKTKFKQNLLAIETLNTIETQGRLATQEERDILAKYSGFGGIPQAFDPNNQTWVNEYTQLKATTTPEEYASIEGSTLNSHYTPLEVVNAMYAGLERLGFKGGTILEPSMGTGHFFGAVPHDMVSNSKLYGVELDSITGRIARQLYPQANIEISGFENADIPDNFADVAIGNIPFGNYKIHDPKFNKYNFLIHDYFIAKSLDKVRPGGIMAYITSSGTLDKESTNLRKYVAERAELLAAIRLPNSTFKQSAGTDVTTDIMFLQKRESIIDASNENWVNIGYEVAEATKGNFVGTHDLIPLNNYYIANPHMMLGEMMFSSNMYGNGLSTTLMPFHDEQRLLPLPELLQRAIENLPANVIRDYATLDDLEDIQEEKDIIPADLNVKNFSYTIVDDIIYYREGPVMAAVDLSHSKETRLKSMIELRALTRNIIDIQMGGCSDEELTAAQEQLGKSYDRFVIKYNNLNTAYNKSIFKHDSDAALLSALEHIDDNGNFSKASIFHKRTIEPYKKIESVESSEEALAVSLYETGKVDIGYMQGLTGKSYEEIVGDLRGLIFKNPEADILDSDINNENILYKNWETADEFLSGRVVEKLDFARTQIERPSLNIAGVDLQSLYEQNVAALEIVQPVLQEAHDINVNIGSIWIDPEYYRQFMVETFNIRSFEERNLKVEYSDTTNKWHVTTPNSDNVETTQTYGTSRMNAYKLLETLLNQQQPEIRDIVITSDNKEKRILNRDETIAIKNKQVALGEAFKKWIFDDPTRRETLVSLYNKLYNSERAREYDGSFLRFKGMNPAIALDKHQRDAVARIILGGNTLLAHTVGAGKTYAMVAAAMEMKRMGIANKPFFVVPNHIVSQWSNAFLELYPGANILTASKGDLGKANRKIFMGKIATGDWDAVIVPQSVFGQIPVSIERQRRKIQQELEAARQYMEDGNIQSHHSRQENHWSIKQMQVSIKNLETQLQALNDMKKDDLLTFEDTGADALFVDEAHAYKNKNIFTKMTRVAGLQVRSNTKRTKDMELKVDYVNELNNGPNNVTFATGTPIANSMVEMYTMQSYLQSGLLSSKNIHHFDNWASIFGQVVSQLEIKPSGNGFQTRQRFAKFKNVPQMMDLFRMVADIKTPDMLNLKVPQLATGKPIVVGVDASEAQKELVSALVALSEKIQLGVIKPEEYNMLTVTHHGKLGALDMRCISIEAFKNLDARYNLGIDFEALRASDHPNNKVNACVDNVFKIYNSTTEDKLTQMIFCDISTPKENDKNFSVYYDIKSKLVSKGVRPEEIAFIHDAKANDIKKEKIFNQMRSGKVRILLGSTSKMGTGTNAQKKLVALHNLDCPWRPADIEQRMGRIVRQGNINDEVSIYNYVTRGTFDAYSWQIIENKQRYISQVMSGKISTNSMDDIDGLVLNYAEVKSIATGNPLIKRKMELEIEIQSLSILEKQYMALRHGNQDKVVNTLPRTIVRAEGLITKLEQDIALRNTNTPESHTQEFSMRLGKNDYKERKDAGALLLKAAASGKYVDKEIGLYRGFKIVPAEINNLGQSQITLIGTHRHVVELSDSDVGAITRIDNVLNNIDQQCQNTTQHLNNSMTQLESLKAQIDLPFEHSKQLEDAKKELAKVDDELGIGKEVSTNVVDEDWGGGEKIIDGTIEVEGAMDDDLELD